MTDDGAASPGRDPLPDEEDVLDARLGRAREEAAQAQSFVRHELRTPLAVLQPVLDMMLAGTAGELEPKQRDYVAMLERSTARLAGMITSVVESGWLEVAPLPTARQLVRLLPLLEELAANVPAQMDASPVVKVGVQGGRRPGVEDAFVVLADGHRLRLALRNVLVNACVYTPASESVTLGLSAVDAGKVIVEVADTGPGIPADELPRLFEVGYQGRAARKLPDRGLGLGLCVARALLEGAGGTIAVTSEAGRGTSVLVTLPAAPA